MSPRVQVAALLFALGVAVSLSVASAPAPSWRLLAGLLKFKTLGTMLLAGLPGTAVWALGLLLGINMIFGGWALVWMALHARSEATASPAQTSSL